MTDESRLTTALAVSLALHAMALTALPLLRRAPPALIRTAPVEVELAPPRPPAPRPPEAASRVQPAPLVPERQVVAPPDAGEKRAPERTRLFSDRDNTVTEERIRRGPGGEAAGHVRGEPPGAAAEPAVAPPGNLAALPSLDKLLPRAGDLAGSPPPAPAPPDRRAPSGRDLLASGDTQAFAGAGGTMDFLPGVREGNVTMLNTKADLFAPFVRRVAGRVFNHLAISFNRALRRGRLDPGRETARVEAVMDKRGRLINARLLERDGSNGLAVDRELLNAADPAIFFDANPPPGAEAGDGHIHFILVVDITVDVAGEPGSQIRRYGYHGVAGVGLM